MLMLQCKDGDFGDEENLEDGDCDDRDEAGRSGGADKHIIRSNTSRDRKAV